MKTAKIFKWKFWLLTCFVCLLPILLGLTLWNSLPDTMAIHFNMYDEPDGFASKAFVVFGFPVLMVLLQTFCCVVNDINSLKHGERKKFERVTKWIIPVMSIVLQIFTIGYGLGWNLEARKVAALLVGGVFIVTGNYLPKFDYIKNYDLSTEKARKINRFIGFGSVIMGILYIISIFFPPLATVICLLLMIPYAVVSIIYGIKTGRK